MLNSKLYSKFYPVLLGTAFLLLFSGTLAADDEHKVKVGNTNFSRKFLKDNSDQPIKIRQRLVVGHVNGKMPSVGTVEKCAKRFYEALEYLPEDLIRKTRLKYVTFLINPSFNNKRVGGLASGDTIILDVNFSAGTVFHEFFHIFDPHRTSKAWNDINGDFIYIGTKYYEANLSRAEKKQSRKNLRKRDIVKGFISEYAMGNEREDRAETFAAMIVEGKNFMKRTKNPVMKAKMEYIMRLFIERDLLSEEFWNKHFESRFNIKNRHF